MLTVERVTALHRVNLFAKVPGRALAAVAQAADEIEVPAGTTLIEAGAIEDSLYAIATGRVRVHLGERTLNVLEAGAVFGELAVLVPEPRAASVTTLERTVVLRLRKPVVDELLVDQPELARSVIEVLVATLRSSAVHQIGGVPP